VGYAGTNDKSEEKQLSDLTLNYYINFILKIFSIFWGNLFL
jgi:hypothetical protein